MIKIAMFNAARSEDEYLDICEKKYPEISFVRIYEKVRVDNAALAKECYAVVVSSAMPPVKEMLEIWRDCGVKYVATRSIGYEYMDVPLIESMGMHAAHTTYSPASVADFAIMLMLMVTRNMKIVERRYEAHDFREAKLPGKELWNMTVGVVGTGAIGEMTAKHLHGFGCRMLAYSRTKRESLDGIVKYTDLDTLLAESDVVTLHMASTPETFHLLNAERLAKMKKGAYLVNTARGNLIDTKALIEALESGHLAGAALDVMENETGIYYTNHMYEPISNHELAILDYMPNVIVTQHMAYYTREAGLDTMENLVKGCLHDYRGEENPWRI